jgi:phosphoglycerate dehydrogenase-like enzyme
MDPLPDGAVVVTEPAADVEFAVLSFEIVDQLAAFFQKMPGLRVVQALSAGMDWLMPYVPPAVIACRAVAVHDGPVSEWVIAAMLTMQRRLPGFLDSQRLARWDRSSAEAMTIRDLEGQTVVIVGHGSIGRALAARLAPFRVRVIGVARHARDGVQAVSALPDLLPNADVVVDLLPHTTETEKLVNREFLARMKPGALFVNAGRGLTVDTEALLDALRAGHVSAALDVTDPEPLPADHPLWRAPNILITPHIAGATERWFPRGYRFAGEQLRRYATGQPLLGVETADMPARNA